MEIQIDEKRVERMVDAINDVVRSAGATDFEVVAAVLNILVGVVAQGESAADRKAYGNGIKKMVAEAMRYAVNPDYEPLN